MHKIRLPGNSEVSADSPAGTFSLGMFYLYKEDVLSYNNYM